MRANAKRKESDTFHSRWVSFWGEPESMSTTRRAGDGHGYQGFQLLEI